MVRCLFEMARASAPSTIFVDEIDSLCRRGPPANMHLSRSLRAGVGSPCGRKCCCCGGMHANGPAWAVV